MAISVDIGQLENRVTQIFETYIPNWSTTAALLGPQNVRSLSRAVIDYLRELVTNFELTTQTYRDLNVAIQASYNYTTVFYHEEVKKLHKTIKDLQANKVKLQSSIARLRADKAGLVQKISQQKFVQSRLDAKCLKLTQDANELRKQLFGDGGDENGDEGPKKRGDYDEDERNDSRIEFLQTQLEELEKEKRYNLAQLAAAKEDYRVCSLALDETKESNSKLVEQLQQLQSQFTGLQSNLEKELKKCQEDLTIYPNQIESLEQQLAEKDKEILAINNLYKDAQKQFEVIINQQKDAFEDNINAFVEKHLLLEDKMKSKQKELDKSKEQGSTTTSISETLRSTSTEYHRRNIELNETNAQLRGQLQALNDQIDLLKNQNASYRRIIKANFKVYYDRFTQQVAELYKNILNEYFLAVERNLSLNSHPEIKRFKKDAEEFFQNHLVEFTDKNISNSAVPQININLAPEDSSRMGQIEQLKQSLQVANSLLSGENQSVLLDYLKLLDDLKECNIQLAEKQQQAKKIEDLQNDGTKKCQALTTILENIYLRMNSIIQIRAPGSPTVADDSTIVNLLDDLISEFEKSQEQIANIRHAANESLVMVKTVLTNSDDINTSFILHMYKFLIDFNNHMKAISEVVAGLPEIPQKESLRDLITRLDLVDSYIKKLISKPRRYGLLTPQDLEEQANEIAANEIAAEGLEKGLATENSVLAEAVLATKERQRNHTRELNKKSDAEFRREFNREKKRFERNSLKHYKALKQIADELEEPPPKPAKVLYGDDNLQKVHRKKLDPKVLLGNKSAGNKKEEISVLEAKVLKAAGEYEDSGEDENAGMDFESQKIKKRGVRELEPETERELEGDSNDKRKRQAREVDEDWPPGMGTSTVNNRETSGVSEREVADILRARLPPVNPGIPNPFVSTEVYKKYWEDHLSEPDGEDDQDKEDEILPPLDDGDDLEQS